MSEVSTDGRKDRERGERGAMDRGGDSLLKIRCGSRNLGRAGLGGVTGNSLRRTRRNLRDRRLRRGTDGR